MQARQRPLFFKVPQPVPNSGSARRHSFSQQHPLQQVQTKEQQQQEQQQQQETACEQQEQRQSQLGNNNAALLLFLFLLVCSFQRMFTNRKNSKTGCQCSTVVYNKKLIKFVSGKMLLSWNCSRRTGNSRIFNN